MFAAHDQGVKKFCLAGAKIRHRDAPLAHTETIANADLYVIDNTPFAGSQMVRRQLLDVEGMPAFWVISPEDLVLQKLLWGRESQSEKQWRDVLGIVKLQAENLDYDYLTEWAEQLGLVDALSICLLYSTRMWANTALSDSFPDAPLKNKGISPSLLAIKSNIHCLRSGRWSLCSQPDVLTLF
jgi:hypothetical protein